MHEEYAVQNTSNKPTPATTLSLPLTVRIPLQARSSKHQMSQQGAGGVLIVRIEMHLAAAMKILRNATNNLPGRLLSQAFFAHLSLFIIYSPLPATQDTSSKLQRVGQPAFASSSEKVVTTQRPTHAEMMFDRIFLARKGFMTVYGYIPEGLGQGLSSIRKKKTVQPRRHWVTHVKSVKPRCLQRSVCTVHSGWMAKTKDARGCWNAARSSWQNFTWIPGCRLQTCSSFLALHVQLKTVAKGTMIRTTLEKALLRLEKWRRYEKLALSASHIGKLKRDSASNSRLSDSSHRGLTPKLIFGARYVVLDKCAWFSSWVAMRGFGVHEDLLRLDQETWYDISWYSVLK